MPPAWWFGSGKVFHRMATNFFAAGKVTSTARFLSLAIIYISERLAWKAAGVTRMGTCTKSESLDQNWEPGGQFQIERKKNKKGAKTFKERKLHEGSVIHFIQWSLQEVKHVQCKKLTWICWWCDLRKSSLICPDLWPSKLQVQLACDMVIQKRWPLGENDIVQILHLYWKCWR